MTTTIETEKLEQMESIIKGFYEQIMKQEETIKQLEEQLVPNNTIELGVYQDFLAKIEDEREMSDSVADLTNIQNEVNGQI